MHRQQKQQPSIAKGPLASSRLQQPTANSTSDVLSTSQELGASESSRRQGGPSSTLTSLSSIPAPTSSPAAARIPRTNNAPTVRRVKARLRPTFTSLSHLFEKKRSDSGDEAEKNVEVDADEDATKLDPPFESQEPNGLKVQQTRTETGATAESSGRTPSVRAASRDMDVNPTAAEDAHTEKVQSKEQDTFEEHQEPSTAADVSFRAIYPYPDNKNAVIWSSRDPKTARTTTMTMLDTRASTGSNSIMSQARRISDQKLWQRQMDIQRDLGVTKSDKSVAVASQDQGDLPTPSSLHRRSSQDHQSKDGAQGEAEDLPRASSFRKSTPRNSSLRLSFRDSASPTPSEERAPSSGAPSNTAVKKSHGTEKEDAGKRSLSRKRVQRALSSSIFTPGPRGTAPTPSPDASVQLVQGPRPKESTSNELYFKQGPTQQEHEPSQHIKRYEAQLDERLHMIQTNNRRLEELKLSWKGHQMDGVLALQDQNYEESDFTDDDDREADEDDWRMEQDQLRREEIFRFFQEQQQGRQLDLEAKLEKQHAVNQALEERMAVMSDHLQNLVEVGESQSRELAMTQQQSVKEREQLERQLSDEKLKHQQLQEALDRALSKKEDHTAAEVARRQAADQEERRRLVTEVESLKNQVQKLKQGIEDKEVEAKAILAQHELENRQSQARIQRLEQQLEDEQYHQTRDQGALLESVERKEDDIQDLKDLLEQRTQLMRRRGDDLNVAHKEIQSLERTLRGLQEYERQDQEELEQLKGESEVLRKELAQEKDMNREQQKRIEILLEAQQETSQVQESRIQELEEELDRRALEHSKTSSTISSVAAAAQAHAITIKELQVQIEDQEQILQEKEDRIQDLEQGLATAKQQDHRVIAYLEQDLQELRSECTKMAELLDEERLKVEALQTQLQQRDEELHDELKQHLEADEQMLREVLSVLQSVESAEEIHGGELYSRLKEGIQDLRASYDDLLKQCSHQERIIEEQRDQLDDCNADLDAQREQFHQALEDLACASDEQRELQRQLQETEAKVKKAESHARTNKGGAEPSNLNKTLIESLRSQVRSLEKEVQSFKHEKERMVDQFALAQEQIQSMDGTIQDQIEAAKSVREKYEERVQALQHEVRKHRQAVVSQEGTMFLYLSVIEKLKLEMRGTKVE
ncbi:hypothetical protein BGZ70_007209 [Mortierella alpina]|uniref:Uncharacterized protein n=1 Tax=Mortierella alpina TaxID=64518 RepID=A0A9P6JDY8_MORAP|nr:hypothetical protein BGZ70_007209 [Mortierella alpina]